MQFFEENQIVDLTHTIHPNIPTWSGQCGFHRSIVHDYSEVGCRVESYQCSAGIGTHLDAPIHFKENAIGVSELSLEQLIAPLYVIRAKRFSSPDHKIGPKDVLAFEEQQGKIKPGSVVVFDTGWSAYWNEPKKYRNEDSKGQMHFPGVSLECAKLLLERKIQGLGIDTLSPDGADTTFPVHHLLLPQNIYLLENLNHLDQVPQKGALIITAPLKVEKASEAPCRCLALFN